MVNAGLQYSLLDALKGLPIDGTDANTLMADSPVIKVDSTETAEGCEESENFVYLEHTLPSAKPMGDHLRNHLGDFSVVLTGVSAHLTVRQRRLKWYGMQQMSGRDHGWWFRAKRLSERTWQAFWAG